MAAWSDTARMAMIGGASAWRLAMDACADLFGGAMPYDPDKVATPVALSKLINEGLTDPDRRPVRITQLSQQDIPSVSSNCYNLVLSVEEAEGKLPASVFVKLPMASYATRWFMNIIQSWRLESDFFRDVARDLPLRTPITYATAWRGSRFCLVQENLNIDPAVTLFTNPDMMEGPSLATVHLCLDALARLHCHHHGLSREQQEAVLPYRYHPFLSPQMGMISRTLNRMALEPVMRKHPGIIPPDVAQVYQRTVSEWPKLLKYWFGGPLSLLHGDSHLGNFFVNGNEMGMLDWQAAHWGKGIRDVQYFLSNSLPSDVLASCERDLITYYVGQRGHYGAPLDASDAWEEYRGFSFHPLMTLIVSIGFGGLNEEQNAVFTEVLRRAVASVQRLDYAHWLEGYLANA